MQCNYAIFGSFHIILQILYKFMCFSLESHVFAYVASVDHVTLVTPLSWTFGHPKANIWYSLQAHKNLTTLALAIPDI